MDRDNIKNWKDVVKWLTEDVWHEVFIYEKDETYRFLDFAYGSPAFVNIDIDKEDLIFRIDEWDPLECPVLGFWVGDPHELRIFIHSAIDMETDTRLKGIDYQYLIQKFDMKIEVNPDEFVSLLSM